MARKIRKWVGEDRVWAIDGKEPTGPDDNESEPQAVDSVESEVEEILDEVNDVTLTDDQQFLASLVSDDDDDTPEDETASSQESEDTPDFDEDAFLFGA